MTLKELLESLETIPNRNIKYTKEQKAVIKHPSGPAWVLAGPGSGKTEILAILVLRLLFVDNDPIQKKRVPPESIFITTFTKKAARNLADRISHYRSHIIKSDTSLSKIDISKLRIGTLQGLCNDLLQEYRYPSYQNVRLMNEFEQAMFIFENSNLISKRQEWRDLPFWNYLSFMFNRNSWRNHSYLPNKWASTVLMKKKNSKSTKKRY
jgi:DNA helicase-2/ATP-dependent DNA helicase PcrA